MNIRHTLIFFFYFTLWARNTGLINAEIIVATENEGGNITVPCIFTFAGQRKIFCKEPCEEGKVLIETDDVTAQSGRYSIAYKEGKYLAYTVLYVSIAKLNKSDAGKYTCGLRRSYKLSSYQEIEIRVEDAPISSKPTLTLQPFSASVPSVPSASTLTTTQSLSSRPESSTPSSASSLTASASGMLLYVRLTLIIMLIVLSATVLIICSKRASTPEEPPVENEYANVTEFNRMSEAREGDGQSTSPPLEMSTVYSFP